MQIAEMTLLAAGLKGKLFTKRQVESLLEALKMLEKKGAELSAQKAT